jgi:hypothetical protein
VVINEVVSNPAAGQADAIELLNRSGATVDLTGWSLTDAQSNFRKYLFPPGTTLAPGQYLTLNASQLGLGLSAGSDDDVWLVRASATGQPLEFGDAVAFGASVMGESWGRYPNGTGRLGTMIAPTLGAANINPRAAGAVVISEVQYHPDLPSAAAVAIEPGILEEDLEFIELTNVSGTPLDLVGWQIRGGVDFDLTESTVVAPGQSVVIVTFDPDAPESVQRLAAFRAHYGLDATVLVRGAEIGQLNNSYDRVELLRPGGTEADPNASEPLSVDEIVYDDLPPWPARADGTGASLHRVSASVYGNLASSWYASAPTPGAASFDGRPGDFNNDGLVDDADIDALFLQIRSATPDLAYDLTGDGAVDAADRDAMILEVIGTAFGDSNLDGVFNSSDLVHVFALGKYEDGVGLNAGWADGDWNGDGEFSTSDLVLAFQYGGYSAAARPAPIDLSALASAWDDELDDELHDLVAKRRSDEVPVEATDRALESLLAW